MALFSGDNFNFGHAFYGKYVQEDENMQAKVKAILNQIHENRVKIKELHIDFALRYCQVMNSYQNTLEDISEDYDSLIRDVLSKREKILTLCNKTLSN